MPSRIYEVYVNNIGRVHTGNNPVEANKHYGDYKRQSKSGQGRAAGEEVTLWVDGEPTRTYTPKGNDENL